MISLSAFAIAWGSWLTPIVVNAGAFVVIFLLSIPACRVLLSHRPLGNRTKPLHYHDENGEATAASVQAYLYKRTTPVTTSLIQTILACKTCFWGTGFREGLPGALGTTHRIQMVMWALLLVQSTALWWEGLCTAHLSLDLRNAASQLLAGLAFAADLYTGSQAGLLISTSQWLQLGLTVATCVCNLLVPRRPHVFRSGVLVSPEYATNALSRISFRWAESVLRAGSLSRTLEVEHLPEIPMRACARGLDDVFTRARRKGGRFTRTSFLWTLIGLHRSTIQLYLLLTALVTSLNFLPQASLFFILQELEQRSHGTYSKTALWFYVAGLVFPRLIVSPIDGYRYWMAHSAFNLRTNQHLSVAIFAKAVSLNVHGDPNINDKSKAPKSTEDQSTHRIVNLMSVDIANASRVLYAPADLLLMPLRLFIAFQALAHLLSWHSAVAGIGTFALSLLISARPARKQATSRQIMLGLRDQKMSALAEVFRGIRQIKLLALESVMEARINQFRDAELQALWGEVIWDLVNRTLYSVSPTILSVVSLGAHAWLHGSINPATAFTAIYLLNTIQTSMSAIPGIVRSLVSSLSSCERLVDFLNGPERVDISTPSDVIEFRNATISYSRNISHIGTGVLKDLNLTFPHGALSVITGPTGAGKSLLLAAILGECHLHQGAIHTPAQRRWDADRSNSGLNESVAYVCQNPWLEAASVKENILFGLPYDGPRYSQVLHACALNPDLKTFPDGDLTQLGPDGVNLSGGQKWRITLARGLYSRAGVLVLDDIFSAVDVHTARHLHEYAVTGPLAAGRTRILVTHNVELCRGDIGYLVALNRNVVSFAGSATNYLGGKTMPVEFQKPEDENNGSHSSPPCLAPTSVTREEKTNRPRQFMAKEHREKGLVRWPVLLNYIQSSGTMAYWIWTLLTFVTYGSVALARTWWLGLWSQTQDSPSTSRASSLSATNKERQGPDVAWYFSIYLLMSVLVVILSVARVYIVSAGAYRASRKLFRGLLHRTLRAPLHWIDTVPLGRILNRFSADFDMVDTQLRGDIQEILACGVDATMAMLSGIAINPLLLILACVLVRYVVHEARRYLAAAQEVKRLDSVMRSPIIDNLTSCIIGLWTIRAYGRLDAYKTQMGMLIDRRTRTSWHSGALNHWLAIQMSTLGAAFVASSAALIVSLRNVDAASAGFVITFALRLEDSMQYTVGRCKSLELDLNAVERVLEYSDIEPECDKHDHTVVPASWPSQGTIQVSNLVVRYAPDLPPVLDGVSFRIDQNERVGIVGRTGAGKSSLVLALFRMLEASQGQILVDGLDISSIRLQDLRSRLAIIPQNPTLLKGTVRSNLDPLNEYGDRQLLRALSQVHWQRMTIQNCEKRDGMDESESLPSPLDLVVGEGGENLSQGQCQLLCLARAMVREPKLLILDEATSAVDQETDARIQLSLRSEFRPGSTTLLVVAHRLSTVVDFDKIIVLGAGKVLECGSPLDLIRKKGGVFRGMVEEDAEADALTKKIHCESGLS
ncbi:hypothetical protein FE257_010923 [Aspergillus nanangensis]|uniref:ABC bile acid transporter n=1 Tax=Aspergillus nanangensis TaxID=2582783 RepID=A0AAD4CVS4_ASPNN|nr:hypothetical protein FE257_010923 [Aspergillus nanangensis]